MFSRSVLRTALSPPVRHLVGQNASANSRTLFSLPDLSSLSPFSGSGGSSNGPQTYHERKILPYAQDELYNVVTNIESYPRFLPFCTGARVLSRSPYITADDHVSAQKFEAEISVGFMAFTETYTSIVTCIPNLSVEAVASSSTPLFESLSSVWRFQPASAKSPHPSQNPALSAVSPISTSQSKTSSTPSITTGQVGSAKNGPTMVSLDLSFSFANPVHAAVSAAFFGQVSRMMVSAFEERCLELYGPGTR